MNFALRLTGRKRTPYVAGSALSGFIVSAAWNPILLCVPSQKGLFDEAPHRHKAILGRPSVSILLPAVS